MWFTALIIIACLIGIPIGIGVLLIALLVFLPIHIGVSGYYLEEEYVAVGWVKALAGLVGVVFEYNDKGGQVQVELGKWVIWQPKEEEDEGKQKNTEDQGTKEKVAKEPQPEKVAPQEKIEFEAKPEIVVEIETKVEADAEKIEDERPSVTPIERRVETPPPPTQIPEPPPTPEFKAPSAYLDEQTEPPKLPPKKKPRKKLSFWARMKRLRRRLLRYLEYWREMKPILWRFLKRLLRIIKFRYVDIDLVCGAGDPSQTGQLFGYVEAIRPLLGKRVTLVVTPDFTQTRVEGAGAVEFAFYLYRLFWAIFALVIRGGLLGTKIWWRERRVKRRAVLPEV